MHNDSCWLARKRILDHFFSLVSRASVFAPPLIAGWEAQALYARCFGTRVATLPAPYLVGSGSGIRGVCWNELLEMKRNSYVHRTLHVQDALQEWRGEPASRRTDALQPYRVFRKLSVGTGALASFDALLVASLGDRSVIPIRSMATQVADGCEAPKDTVYWGVPPTRRQWRQPPAPLPSRSCAAALKQSCGACFIILFYVVLVFGFAFGVGVLTLPRVTCFEPWIPADPSLPS